MSKHWLSNISLFFRFRNKPLVSVIMPTFNAAATISRAIESVTNQQYRKIELILIDGFSGDETVSIIQEASAKDSRIRYISERDRGPYDAMNKGLALCRGNWVYFLGSDDMLINENILQELYSNGYFSQEKVFYGNVIIDGETSWAKDQEVYAGEFDLHTFLKRNICHQSIFYPRWMIREAGFFNQDYVVCADWDFNMRCYAMEPFLYVDKVIASFRAGGISSSGLDPAFSKEFPGNIIRYFNLDADDPKLLEPGSVFRTIVNSYHKIKQS